MESIWQLGFTGYRYDILLGLGNKKKRLVFPQAIQMLFFSWLKAGVSPAASLSYPKITLPLDECSIASLKITFRTLTFPYKGLSLLLFSVSNIQMFQCLHNETWFFHFFFHLFILSFFLSIYLSFCWFFLSFFLPSFLPFFPSIFPSIFYFSYYYI